MCDPGSITLDSSPVAEYWNLMSCYLAQFPKVASSDARVRLL